MQSYLYFGGNQDILNIPTPDGAESVQFPSGVTDRDVYNRSTLSVGDVSVTIVNNLPNFPSFDRLNFPTSLSLFGPSYRLSPATLSATDSAV
jgi:hypothetical protein